MLKCYEYKLVFFFNQKTAYEMRISDWSADVCSSDLQSLSHADANAQAIKAGDPLHWTGTYFNWNSRCASCHSTNLRKNYDAKAYRYDTRKNGRASGRARVCRCV